MGPEIRRRRPSGAAAWSMATAVVLFLAAVVVLPLGALVATVAADPRTAASGLLQAEARHALLLSVVIAGICLVTNGVVGVAGAIVLVRQRFLLRPVLDALVELPLAVSPVMTGLGFLLLFGRHGVLEPVLAAMGIRVAFAIPGLLLATLFVTVPFTLREVALVLEELGTVEEQAAATLGASGWQTFWRVTMPNLRHALIAGSTLTTARALGEFGAVLVLGGAIANRTSTATTFIHGAIEERQEAAAYAMALLLAGLAVALLAILERTRRARPTWGA